MLNLSGTTKCSLNLFILFSSFAADLFTGQSAPELLILNKVIAHYRIEFESNLIDPMMNEVQSNSQ